MAWIAGGFEGVIDARDNGNNRVRKVYALTSVDMAAAEIDMLQVVNYWEAVSDLSSLTYSIRKIYDNDAFALPASGVQAEAKAVMVGRDEVILTKTHTINIQGPKPANFNELEGDGANIVDFGVVAVQNYFNLFSPAGEATLSDGEQVADDGWLRGHRATRSSNRG